MYKLTGTSQFIHLWKVPWHAYGI